MLFDDFKTQQFLLVGVVAKGVCNLPAGSVALYPFAEGLVGLESVISSETQQFKQVFLGHFLMGIEKIKNTFVFFFVKTVFRHQFADLSRSGGRTIENGRRAIRFLALSPGIDESDIVDGLIYAADLSQR